MSETLIIIIFSVGATVGVALVELALVLWFIRDGERRTQAILRDIGLGVARIDARTE